MEATGTFHNRLLRWRAPPQTAEQQTTKIENVITPHSRKCFHSRFAVVCCFIGRQPSSVTYLIQGSSFHLTSECYRCPANRFSILNSTLSSPTVQRRKCSTSEPLALGNYRLNCDQGTATVPLSRPSFSSSRGFTDGTIEALRHLLRAMRFYPDAFRRFVSIFRDSSEGLEANFTFNNSHFRVSVRTKFFRFLFCVLSFRKDVVWNLEFICSISTERDNVNCHKAFTSFFVLLASQLLRFTTT